MYLLAPPLCKGRERNKKGESLPQQRPLEINGSKETEPDIARHISSKHIFAAAFCVSQKNSDVLGELDISF